MMTGGRAKLLSKAAVVAGVLVGLVLLCGAANAQKKIVKLKWVFDEDPRPLIPETKKHLQVIKFLALEKIEENTGSTGVIFYLSVKMKTEIDCVKEIKGKTFLFFEMPEDHFFIKKREGYVHYYDTRSVKAIQPMSEYFGLFDCNISRLSYIEESSYIR